MDFKGDDLDDGLDYEIGNDEIEGFAFNSDSEHEVEEEQAQNALDQASEEGAESGSNPVNKKRQVESEEERPMSKRQMKLKGRKNIKKEKVDAEVSEKSLLSKQSPEMIADLINTKINKNVKLSSLELIELHFNKSNFVSTSAFELDRNLTNFQQFVDMFFKDHLKKKQHYITVLSMSAIRSCDINRATTYKTLKLIKKNKVDNDLKLLKSGKFQIISATPGRLIKFIDHIKLDSIIVDSSYLNLKKQNIWDLNENFKIINQLVKNGSKLYLY